jgi:hypothetical protein
VTFATVAAELRDLVAEDDDRAVTGLRLDRAASDATIGGRA